MIEFDPSKVHHDAVRISQIDRASIRVFSDHNGQPYIPTGIKHRIASDGSTVIPIHPRAAHLYLKTHSLRTFAKPGRLTYLFYYGDKVLLMDVQPMFRYQAEQSNVNWESPCVAGFQEATRLIQQDSWDQSNKARLYFDGDNLFYMLPDSTATPLKHGFALRQVRLVNLSRMAYSFSRSLLTGPNKDSPPTEPPPEDANKKVTVLVVKPGSILTYTPPDTDTLVMSSVIADPDTEIAKKKRQQGKNSSENALREKLTFNSSGVRLNLNFALRAGRVIGRNYGYLETEFLNIPQLVIDTGAINLGGDLDQTTRSQYPLDMPVWDGLAYLMRFFAQEQNMERLRDLASLFSFTLRFGLLLPAKAFQAEMDKESRKALETMPSSGIPQLNVNEFLGKKKLASGPRM